MTSVIRQRLSLFLFFACLATALLSSLASNTVVPGIDQDILNHIVAIMQAKLALMAGQFPLRVAPLWFDGWQYPFFQFYAPSSYALGGFIYAWLTPSNPFLAYKMTLWCALVIGGVYLYRLANAFVQSKPAAFLASVVYLTSPYYLIVIYRIAAFNEAIALGVLPAVVYYTLQRYYYPTQIKTLLQASVAWYLLATIHVVTFFYASFFIGLLLLLMTLKRHRYVRNLLQVGVAYSLSSLMAMWYLAPIALLNKYFIMANTFDTRTTVIDEHRPFLANLLSPVVNGMGLGGDVASQIHPTVGLPMLMGVGVCFYAICHRSLVAKQRRNDWMPLLLGVFLLLFLMAWSPINFWQWLPKAFLAAQYPWRLLAQAMWIGALLFAWAVCWLFKNKLDSRHVVLGLGGVLMMTGGWLSIATQDSLPVKTIMQHPAATDGAMETYFLDIEKNPQFAHHVNSMQMLNQNLSPEGDRPFFISRAHLDAAKVPTVLLSGTLSGDQEKLPAQAIALVNGKAVSHFAIKPGAFHWEIPLSFIKQSTDKKLGALLQFKWVGTQKKQVDPTLMLTKAVLTGFLSAPETLTVDKVQPYCHPQGSKTVCLLTVSAATRLLALPIFYYPGLLHITVNGKSVPYESLLEGNHLMAAIVPSAGKNVITMQFRGLVWANVISACSWGGWLVLLVWIILRRNCIRLN